MSGAIGPDDPPGYFNYTDYEHTALRMFRAAVTAAWYPNGHVGFLTRVEPGRLESALEALAAGRWEESRRMTLCARVPGRADAIGLNDVVVEKAVSQHVVKISVVV